MSKFRNDKKDRFIESIPQASIDLATDNLSGRCKFNFSYFEVQPAGQAFGGWDFQQQTRLLEKLKDYSQNSLAYWRGQGGIFVTYGAFPAKSDFVHPKHVPHQAQWARFRLESAMRLVGFVVPGDRHGKEHPTTKQRFDANTFYVVFLDADHRFYKVEKK